MFYEHPVTVTAETTEATAETTTIKWQRGWVSHAAVQFPAGCAGLVHVKVKRGGIQIWPRNQDATITSDNWVVEWNELLELKNGYNSFDVVCWNEDTVFDHTVTLRATVLPLERVMPLVGIQDVVDRLDILLNRIGATSE